jgi:hypothetical protein
VLIKIEKLLNPGGVVIIKTPNIESLDARLYKKSFWGGLHCPRHWVLFSENSFKTALEGSGLAIDKLKYTQGAPFWAISIMVKLKKWGKVKITKDKPMAYHPLMPFLHIMFAGIDFIRGGLGAKTSQMFIYLKKKS